jgi:hypothetical protein
MIGEEMRDPLASRTMAMIAASYETLAAWAERRRRQS